MVDKLLILCLFFFPIISSFIFSRKSKAESPETIRAHATTLHNNGQVKDLLNYLLTIENKYGNLSIDNKTPSLYSYRGVALASHAYRDKLGAIEAFKNLTKFTPLDTRGWINLGEVYLQNLMFEEAIVALSHAEALGDTECYSRLLKAKGWMTDYQDFERISALVEKEAIKCSPNISLNNRYSLLYYDDIFRTGICTLDSTTAFEWTGKCIYVYKYVKV